jgi:hypothetical protein
MLRLQNTVETASAGVSLSRDPTATVYVIDRVESI